MSPPVAREGAQPRWAGGTEQPGVQWPFPAAGRRDSSLPERPGQHPFPWDPGELGTWDGVNHTRPSRHCRMKPLRDTLSPLREGGRPKGCHEFVRQFLLGSLQGRCLGICLMTGLVVFLPPSIPSGSRGSGSTAQGGREALFGGVFILFIHISFSLL